MYRKLLKMWGTNNSSEQARTWSNVSTVAAVEQSYPLSSQRRPMRRPCRRHRVGDGSVESRRHAQTSLHVSELHKKARHVSELHEEGAVNRGWTKNMVQRSRPELCAL